MEQKPFKIGPQLAPHHDYLSKIFDRIDKEKEKLKQLKETTKLAS